MSLLTGTRRKKQSEPKRPDMPLPAQVHRAQRPMLSLPRIAALTDALFLIGQKSEQPMTYGAAHFYAARILAEEAHV